MHSLSLLNGPKNSRALACTIEISEGSLGGYLKLIKDDKLLLLY